MHTGLTKSLDEKKKKKNLKKKKFKEKRLHCPREQITTDSVVSRIDNKAAMKYYKKQNKKPPSSHQSSITYCKG